MQQHPSQITTVIADVHVHLYDVSAAPALFDAAIANLRRAAESSVRIERPSFALLLAETNGQGWFDDVYRTLPGIGEWQIERTAEDCSLLAMRSDGTRILLIAGQQVITREGIEVLVFGCRAAIAQRAALLETIAAGHSRDALVVLPWGAGKWMGKRGELVKRAFLQAAPHSVFVGDNAGRPRLWPRHSLLAQSAGRGIPVLSGSDPLPVGGDHCRVGSMGCVIDVALSSQWPARDLVSALKAGRATVREIGDGVRLGRFVRNQIALRMRNRRHMG